MTINSQCTMPIALMKEHAAGSVVWIKLYLGEIVLDARDNSPE